MRLHGTSVVKLKDFFVNLKDLAGTCFSITRHEYDKNPYKVCSYSHIYSNFGLSWNDCIKEIGLEINKKFSFPIKQGRKPIDRSNYKKTECLRCGKLFDSWNIKYNRICDNCKY